MNMVADTSTIQSAVVETYRETLSAEEKMDQFLDLINEARAILNDLNRRWADLNLRTECYISDYPASDGMTLVMVSMEGAIARALSLINKTKANNDYFVGVRSQIETLEDNVEFTRELCADIKIKTDPQIMSLGAQLESLDN
jgi:hypothetical protein